MKMALDNLSGCSRLTAASLIIAAILVTGFAGAGAWASRLVTRSEDDARTARLEAAADVLSLACESALLQGPEGLTPVLEAAGTELGLTDCTVTSGNNTVLGAFKSVTGGESEAGPGRQAVVRREVGLPDDSRATLQLVAPLPPPTAALLPVLAGVGTIAALVIPAVLVIFLSTARRSRAMSLVGNALLAMSRNGDAEPALMINEKYGREAEAWNAVLDTVGALRRELARRQARKIVQSRMTGNGESDIVLDALWSGLLVIGTDETVRHANGAASVLLRRSVDEVDGAPLGELLPEAVVRSAHEILEQGHTAEPTIELDSTEPGSSDILRYTVRPIRRDAGIEVLIAIEDVTQQRVSDRARQSFVTQASHELRTPLTNIRLYAEMAIDESSDEAMRAKCFNVINQEAGRLDRIVSDMLSVSQIEAGSIGLEHDDVRLAEILASMEHEYRAQAEEASIDLTFNLAPKLPVIEGDREKLLLVMHNLLGNAIKYTPKGGSVEFTADADDNRVVIEVVDSGIGISVDELERIFDKFYRADDPRIEGIKGSGLGLALSREIAALHGGNITVSSEIDRGSTFSLTLPVAKRKAA